jgi:hypothetical protein
MEKQSFVMREKTKTKIMNIIIDILLTMLVATMVFALI